MSADKLPRIYKSLIERNYQSGIPAAKPHFRQVQAYTLANYKVSGSRPICNQLFLNWSEKKPARQWHITRNPRKCEQ